MSQRPYLVRGAMGTSDPIGSPGPAERAPDRSSGPVAQVARDQARLRASQAAVTSDVIEFQLARQRAGLASLETIEPLSAREREVLALLGAGYADGQIADELFISKKTASVHVANIKAKLGAASRVEIALIAARRGLAEGPPLTLPDDAPASRARSTTVICPFKGLASYEAADARYFFGREPVVAALVARMVGAGMLGLVGPSGSGKSSVIRAGLLPALAEGVLPGSDRWSVGMLRPGATPTAELRAALAAALRRAGVELPEGGAVTDALERLPDGVRLIVVADQFEELFTVCDDEADRAVFVDELVQLSRDFGGRAALVVAIRADQYGRCAAYRELAEGLAANHLLIGPMTAEELGRAVELPARSAGLRVEPQLTAALVSAVVGEPGALPLLSTTLLELWQRRDGRTLRLEAYERIGGVSGAVNRIAEAAYARLTHEQQVIARSVLLRLIAVGDDGSLARRPVAPATFDAESDPDVRRVLAILTETRLVAIDEGRLELAHEALLREWPRLRSWIEDDAGDRAVREHLARAAMEWDRGGRSPAELYRGSRLAAAQEWGAAHDRELSAAERSFLESSGAEAERELLEQRRTNRRLRVLLGAAAVLLGVALVAAGFAALQQRRVEDAAATARSRELAASAVAVLDEDPSLAKLLALSAAEIASPPLESIAVLHQTLADDRIVFRYRWPEDQVLGGSLWVDLDGEGRRFVASGVFDEPSSHVDLIDIASAALIWRYTPVETGVVVGPSFFVEDGAGVAVGTAWVHEEPAPATAIGVRVLDATVGREVRTVDVGPCGGMVVAATADHLLVRFVTTPPGEPTRCSPFHREASVGIGLVDLKTWTFEVLSQRASVGSHALSLDGRRVAFDEFDGDRQLTVVREIATGEPILRVDSFEHDAWARALSDDGSLLLTGDDPMQVFDVEAGGNAPVARFHGHAGESFHAEFIPGTSIVYSTGRDLTLRSWDARTGEELTALGGAGSGRAAMAIDANRILVADVETPTVALVDLAPAGEIAAVETCPGFVAAGSLAVVGQVAAILEGCDADSDFLGSVQILDVDAGSIRHTILGTDGQLLRLSPDGSRVVYQSSSLVVEEHFPWAGPLVVVDVATGDPILQLDGLCRWDWEQIDRVGRNAAGDCEAFPRQPFPIWTLAIRWSPDGSMIFAADNHNAEGYFVVWDARTGALIHAGSTEGGQKAFDAIFTPDSNELIVARFDTGRLDRYSTTTWELVQSVELPASVAGRDRVWFAGLTADATTLVAIGGLLGGGGGSLLWLDAETLAPSREPLEHIHDGSVKAVSMSADGSLLATGASGDPIRVWNVATGTLVHEIPIGDLQVQGVAFVDGQHLAFAPETGNVLVVTLDPSELLALARSSLTRGFTPRECERFDFGDDCPTLEELRSG